MRKNTIAFIGFIVFLVLVIVMNSSRTEKFTQVSDWEKLCPGDQGCARTQEALCTKVANVFINSTIEDGHVLWLDKTWDATMRPLCGK